MKLPDKVRYNENPALVEKIQNALKKTDGHCPCRLLRTPDTICICKEFRDQINDPDFEGYCYCKLFYKEK